jgi:small subunit ribosomal protein S6
MNLYEHTIIAKQSFSKSQMESLKEKYSNLIQKNSGEIIKIEDWGLIHMTYQIDNNKKGNYIHIKLKGDGKTINELEKKERIDSNLLRFLTVRVKKFDLENDKLVLKNKD